MTNIKDQLEAWGRWVRNPDLKMHYRCSLAVIMAQNVGGTVGVAYVSDEEAAHVERAMCQLKRAKPDYYGVLYEYYVKGRSTRQIAKDSPWSDRMVFDMLKGGELWIEGAIASSVFIA